MHPAHRALLSEIRHRLEAARDDPQVTNTDGSNYWGPYVTRAINEREDDGPALVQYIKDVLRKSGESEGWNSLLEAGRLDISFEDMVFDAVEPIRGLFSDEDRRIAGQSLGEQRGELERRRAATEARIAARTSSLAGEDVGKLRQLAIEATDSEEAIAINTAVLGHAPKDVVAMNRLGRAYEEIGLIDQAAETFRGVVAADPGNTIATKHLRDLGRRKER